MTCLEAIGPVDHAMLKGIAAFCTSLNQSATASPANGPVASIFLSTEGGDFYAALGIYDMLRASKVPVRIVCVGPVFSAGTIILMGSDDRVAYKNTTFLIHYGSSTVESEDERRQEKRVVGDYKNLFLKHLDVRSRTVSEWLRRETYMDSRRALHCGLIKGVI